MGSAALRIVHFPDLERWDVKFFLGQIKSKYPLVSLSEFVTEHNEKIRPYDEPDKTFKILGVNNTDGIFHAYDAKGKSIKQPYKKVNAGDFAYNPYRINVGSIGWVPPEHDGAYISPAYVVFSIDESVILPELFWFIMKSEFFNQALRAATAGSVRMNLTYPLLVTLKIPIPPLSDQKKIVDFWESENAKKNLLENKSKKKFEESIRALLSEIGLSMPPRNETDKIFIRQWKDFDRWSVIYNQTASSMMDIRKGKYSVTELGEILDLVQYGTSEKASNNKDGVPILRILNIKEGQIDTTNIKHISIDKETLKNLVLFDGDILIIRTSGSRELVGTCAVFHEKGEFVFASYLIRLRVLKQKALPDYVAHFINSPVGRQQINLLSRQIMQNNINSQELRSLTLPLPPLHIQKKIIRQINLKRRESLYLNIEAKNLLEKTTIAVEQMMLGLKLVENI